MQILLFIVLIWSYLNFYVIFVVMETQHESEVSVPPKRMVRMRGMLAIFPYKSEIKYSYSLPIMIVPRPCSNNYMRYIFSPTLYIHLVIGFLTQRRLMASLMHIVEKRCGPRLTLKNRKSLSRNPPFLFPSNGIIAPLMLFTTILDLYILYSNIYV